MVQELRGEKIDIVPFDRDPARYIINAIQPAEVNKVIVDEADHRMELVVPDEKLSLAIGRKGQNVRLASQLTGWKLDIISESKFKQMEEEALQALREIDGVDEDDRPRDVPTRLPRARGDRGSGRGGARVRSRASALPKAAQSLKERAETTMERLRRDRIEAGGRTEPSRSPSARSCASSTGVGMRTLQPCSKRPATSTVIELAREDADRLAIRTGLGIKKARLIQQGARHFLEHESKEIDAARARFEAERPDAAAEVSAPE